MNVRAPKDYWNGQGRSIVFALAATSIACLLFDFYGLCPMRTFTFFIFLPALIALSAFAVWIGSVATGDSGAL
jgi:hypothetical protein